MHFLQFARRGGHRLLVMVEHDEWMNEWVNDMVEIPVERAMVRLKCLYLLDGEEAFQSCFTSSFAGEGM